jgi:nicotinate-nucleotide adenylyltransferase
MPEAPVGILGGTFDPVHSAHLALAETARRRFGLGRVLFIPAGQPRHRHAPQAPAADRLAMVRLAITDRDDFELDAGEALSDAPSYTVPTLLRLRERFGTRVPLLLLVGADAFLGLPSWHRWRELFDLAHIAVATRPGYALDAAAMAAAAPDLAQEFRQRQHGDLGAAAGAIASFPLVAGTVSATETRALLAAGRDPGDWLPPGILDYIRTHHLYGT